MVNISYMVIHFKVQFMGTHNRIISFCLTTDFEFSYYFSSFLLWATPLTLRLLTLDFIVIFLKMSITAYRT